MNMTMTPIAAAIKKIYTKRTKRYLPYEVWQYAYEQEIKPSKEQLDIKLDGSAGDADRMMDFALKSMRGPSALNSVDVLWYLSPDDQARAVQYKLSNGGAQ